MDIYGGSLISVLLVSMSSCAETNSRNIADIVPSTVSAETPLENPIPHPDESKEHIIMMWQKQPGTATYNAQGEPIGSLRFIPKVRVYETVGEFVRIDRQKDVWVKASDLTENKPANLLGAPENAAPLPQVDIRQGRKQIKMK